MPSSSSSWFILALALVVGVWIWVLHEVLLSIAWYAAGAGV